MDVIFRFAWMQKHPTPTNARGDFHWHPPDIPAAIRTTLTELLAGHRAQAQSQGISLWILQDGQDGQNGQSGEHSEGSGAYVAWARTFSALSPADRRRYTGMAVTIAQAGQPVSPDAWSKALPEIFARLPLVPAAPFAGEPAKSEVRLDGNGGDALPGASRPLAVDPAALESLVAPGERGLAAAVYLGGAARAHAPDAERLPALFGRLLSWLPPSERGRSRTGAFVDSRSPVEPQTGSVAGDHLIHYLTSAWFCPGAIRARQPAYAVSMWQLILDLAATRGAALAELFGDLTGVAGAWDTAEELHRHLVATGTLTEAELAACDARAPRPLLAPLSAAPGQWDAGWLWNRLLHYWGRGFLPEGAAARLAALLALRVAADHLFYLDAPDRAELPGRYVRRLRYEAILPAAHVQAMRRALSHYLPTLSDHSEVELA